MKISIGADHRGFALKQALMAAFTHVAWTDVGAFDQQRSDYPPFACAAVDLLRAGKVDSCILLCGSGVGMSIAANRYKGVYAGLCWQPAVAKAAKEDDGINVLVLPADFVTQADACAIVQAWLNASFKGGRYQARLAALDTAGNCF